MAIAACWVRILEVGSIVLASNRQLWGSYGRTFILGRRSY